jgi:uncharacterized protein YyaL (SSP411 family)
MNPVDWYPWGFKAFQKAEVQDKPIFLSIGYSSCRWCHVMKRESFEDEETASILNRNFISIKVDREERPDIDDIYMKAVVSMTGQGGWPLSVFLTPSLQPFFGGTYYPPEDRYSLPSFKKVLLRIIELWQHSRSEIKKSSNETIRRINEVYPERKEDLSDSPIEEAYSTLSYQYDRINGGFGSSPKFPNPSALLFLLRYYKRKRRKLAIEMVETTLTKMAKGGIFDHLAGGFHRYSVDNHWLVPHFEKMLYDNALMSIVYTEAWQVTKNPIFKDTVIVTLNWLIKEMRDSRGGFYSAQDAESDGDEGLYYLWTFDELKNILDKKELEIMSKRFGISKKGNFEEAQNILHIEKESILISRELQIPEDEVKRIIGESIKTMQNHRRKRVRPSKDDKILTSWNGLIISALAKAYQVFEEETYLKVAEDASSFIQRHLIQEDRILRRWRDGEASIDGFLEDYAFFVMGLIDLYESNFSQNHLELAKSLSEYMIEQFRDNEQGAFYTTKKDKSDLIIRLKERHDGAMLSGNGVAAINLARLGVLLSDEKFLSFSKESIKGYWGVLDSYPESNGQMLSALDFVLGSKKEIILAGEKHEMREMLRLIRGEFIPNKVIAYAGKDLKNDKFMPMLEGKVPIKDSATVYICENYMCKEPVIDNTSLIKQLGIE